MSQVLIDHDPIKIPDIGNFYGGLYVKVKKHIPYWSIEDHDGHSWERIPEPLYYELIKFKDSK